VTGVCRLTLHTEVENARAALRCLLVPEQRAALWILLVVLLTRKNGFGNERRADDVVARLRLRDVNAVCNRGELSALELAVHAMREQRVARLGFELHYALVRVTRNLNVLDVWRVDDLVHERAVVLAEVIESSHVDLIQDEHDRLASEERLDGMKKFALRDS
jgi:hypothetical protein